MRIILCLFLISCSVSIYAQQRQIIINGFVFDKDRKEPLQSATVSIEAGNSPKISRQTDELGRFRLTTTNRSLITLSINYIGYANYSVQVNTSDTSKNEFFLDKIALSQNTGQLADVQIKGVRRLLKINDEVLVYSLKDDTANNKGSLSLAVKQMPFVNVDINGTMSYKDTKKFLILIDGKVQPGLSQNPTQALKAIPASVIDRIELADPPPYRYQEMDYDAVFNIITKDNIGGATASMDINQNSRGGYGRNLYFYYNKRKLGINLDLNDQKSKLNELVNNFYSGEGLLPSSQVLNNDYQERTSDASLALNHISKAGLFSLMGKYAKRKDLTNSDLDNSLSSDFKNNNDQLTNQLTWQKTTKNKDSYFIGIKNINTDGEQSNNDNLSSSFNFESSNEFSFQTDYSHSYKGKLPAKLDLGIKYFNRLNETSDRITDILNYKQDILIPYLSLNWKFKGSYSLTTALRYEYTGINADYIQNKTYLNKSIDALLPQVSLFKTISKTQTASLQLKSRTTRPSILYLNPYVNTVNPEYIVRGNPDLLPQNNYSLSLNYSQFFNKLNISIQYLKTLVTREISEITYQNPITNQLELTYANLGKTYFDGVYINFGGKILPRWRFNSTSSIGYISMKSAGLKNSGLFWYSFISTEYGFKDGFAVQVMSNISSPSVQLQGTATGTRLFNLSVKKNIFSDNGVLNFSVSDPFKTRRSFYSNVIEGNFTRNSVMNRQARMFTLSLYVKVGKLGDNKVAAPKEVSTDDQKTKANL